MKNPRDVDYHSSEQLAASDDDQGEIEYDHKNDVFGTEEGHDIKYKTLSWPAVAFLMLNEILTNGTVSLPSAVATVGLAPGVILITFLGIFATYTSWLLIKFKIRHPEVHSMGDAGYILFGPIGREVLGLGTVIFSICGAGSLVLSGALALSVLSDSKLLSGCNLLYSGIFTAPLVLLSSFRTFDRLSWLAIAATITFVIACIVAMIGAGLYPIEPRTIAAAKSSSFYVAFTAVLNPVFAYAGHFMFFILISEMRHPEDAMKSAYALQITATTVYIVFAVVSYVYLGDAVQSPSFLSLETKWSKAAFGVALLNFVVAGSLYTHTAAKLVFTRIFRKSRHLHSHTVFGWGMWLALILLANGAAFVLAVGVPIFNYLVGLTASLFAAWYTYGIAGAFWLHDSYHDHGLSSWRRKWVQSSLAIATLVAGGFICIGGCYATIKGIVIAYETNTIVEPFACR